MNIFNFFNFKEKIKIKNKDTKVSINGKEYTASKSVTILIDDLKIETEDIIKGINIVIQGDCGDIEVVSSDISIEGNVFGKTSSTSGDIICKGNITGNVSTVSGDIEAKVINAGTINTVSGDINL